MDVTFTSTITFAMRSYWLMFAHLIPVHQHDARVASYKRIRPIVNIELFNDRIGYDASRALTINCLSWAWTMDSSIVEACCAERAVNVEPSSPMVNHIRDVAILTGNVNTEKNNDNQSNRLNNCNPNANCTPERCKLHLLQRKKPPSCFSALLALFVPFMNEAHQAFKIRRHIFFAQLMAVTYMPSGLAVMLASSPLLGGMKATLTVASHVSVPETVPRRSRMDSIHCTVYDALLIGKIALICT